MLAGAPHAIFKGGREWRIDSTRFSISTTVTGVILDLEPGALRELHWHPNADEWQCVIEGDLSVTMFGSHGRFRTEQLRAGDVGYIPQGYGHSIENVGSNQSRMLIGFNTGFIRRLTFLRGSLAIRLMFWQRISAGQHPCSRSFCARTFS